MIFPLPGVWNSQRSWPKSCHDDDDKEMIVPDVGSGDDDDAFVAGGTGYEDDTCAEDGDGDGMVVLKLSSGGNNMVTPRT